MSDSRGGRLRLGESANAGLRHSSSSPCDQRFINSERGIGCIPVLMRTLGRSPAAGPAAYPQARLRTGRQSAAVTALATAALAEYTLAGLADTGTTLPDGCRQCSSAASPSPPTGQRFLSPSTMATPRGQTSSRWPARGAPERGAAERRNLAEADGAEEFAGLGRREARPGRRPEAGA